MKAWLVVGNQRRPSLKLGLWRSEGGESSIADGWLLLHLDNFFLKSDPSASPWRAGRRAFVGQGDGASGAVSHGGDGKGEPASLKEFFCRKLFQKQNYIDKNVRLFSRDHWVN